MFPDQDPGTTGEQTGQEREIAENTDSGENIGAPIAATDPSDVLTYAFEGADNATDEALFDIDRATGQIMTKSALDHEASGGDEYTVTVTATDPFGETADAEVTIEVTDVNARLGSYALLPVWAYKAAQRGLSGRYIPPGSPARSWRTGPQGAESSGVGLPVARRAGLIPGAVGCAVPRPWASGI